MLMLEGFVLVIVYFLGNIGCSIKACTSYHSQIVPVYDNIIGGLDGFDVLF